MYRSAVGVSGLVTVSLLILAGCGGGGSTGGAPVTPPSSATTQQVFVLDFVHHTVTTAVQPQYVDRNPGDTGADLKLAMTFPAVDPGSPGREQMTCRVKNNTTGSVGINDQGTVTGIDLCFVSTVFETAGNVVVPGGGYFGYSALNPLTGTPIYNIPGPLAAGATSAGAPVSLILPATATQATVTVVVRTDTVFGNPPDLTRWYLTTIAGHSTTPGYRDGPASQALFYLLENPLYRDNLDDVLVADYGNNCIRRVYQGQVTTFAGDGGAGTCDAPYGLGRDAQGNVYITEYWGDCVSLVGPGGGSPTVIAGLRGTSGDVSNVTGDAARFGYVAGLAVSGNLVYVCDEGNGKMKLLTHNGSGSLFDPTSWYVTDITYGAGFNAPAGVAVDAGGNVYVADDVANKVYVLPLGSSTWTVIAGTGASGEGNGTGWYATFNQPVGIAVDQAGIVYVTESSGSLRRLRHNGGALANSHSWTVDTLVPSGASSVDGFTGTGKVYNLRGVSCARDGTLYLTEDNDVRRVDRTRN